MAVQGTGQAHSVRRKSPEETPAEATHRSYQGLPPSGSCWYLGQADDIASARNRTPGVFERAPVSIPATCT